MRFTDEHHPAPAPGTPASRRPGMPLAQKLIAAILIAGAVLFWLAVITAMSIFALRIVNT